MGARARIGIAAVAVCVIWVVLATAAQASSSGLYGDDDGIPEERNIEYLTSRGILDPWGAEAEATSVEEISRWVAEALAKESE